MVAPKKKFMHRTLPLPKKIHARSVSRKENLVTRKEKTMQTKFTEHERVKKNSWYQITQPTLKSEMVHPLGELLLGLVQYSTLQEFYPYITIMTILVWKRDRNRNNKNGNQNRQRARQKYLFLNTLNPRKNIRREI